MVVKRGLVAEFHIVTSVRGLGEQVLNGPQRGRINAPVAFENPPLDDVLLCVTTGEGSS